MCHKKTDVKRLEPYKLAKLMINPAQYIQKIFVTEECAELPYTRRITERAGLPVEIIKERRLPGFNSGDQYHFQLTNGKRNLLLCRNQGHFFKPCPGTREYQCCEYQVINIGMNCPMDCVYCILQAYLNNPWLTFFVNIDDLLTELEEAVNEAGPERFWRIGTGEFTDSMALDKWTGLSEILTGFTARHPNTILELKTKSAIIDNLADLDHQGRTITAWSLNSPEIMEKEELRTATLDERLAAAAQCARWGYKLAFHFDPIIYHADWRAGYAETIKRLFAAVPADQIAWISMGALRFLPGLRQITADRFPRSRFMAEEFIMGLDGKCRYFRDLRVEMYKYIYKLLRREADRRTCIYFCMESDEIWQEVMGFRPADKGGLPAMLEQTVQRGA